MKQGQGEFTTELKQRGLGYAFKVNTTVISKWAWARYFHFDLNAGSGFNEQIGVIGSPITFINAMRDSGVNKYHASFVDCEKDAVDSLLPRVSQNDRCFVHHGDNAAFVSMIPGIISHYGEKPDKAIGTVLCDPNGYQVPVSELQWLNESCPKIDVVIHWNATANKRARYGVFPAHENLSQVMRLIGKQHWLIREPASMHQFTLVIGRNMKSGDYRAQGFHHLDSPAGLDILRRCDLKRNHYITACGQMGLL